MKHCFGGEWTKKKLNILEKYLNAYIKIFENNIFAKKLQRFYVDGFAGTGSIFKESEANEQLSFYDFPEFEEFETDFIPGSARIALELDPGFHRYFFIDKKQKHVEELNQFKLEFPSKNIEILKADCNLWLQDWCKNENWHGQRAVVFLDPYGMQVEWRTIEAIAHTQAMDLWLLFPLGQAVNRLLPAGSPPPTHWAKALDRILGTGDWRTTFYQKEQEPDLFNLQQIRHQKNVSIEDIGKFFIERLKGLFSGVASEPMFLYNSSNCPIYLLCFAAGNPKGAPTAVKIAQSIIRKEFADGWK